MSRHLIPEYELRDGKVCEYGKPISNERIVKLLKEAEFVHSDLQIERNRNMNLKISLDHFRWRCLKLENGITDCVGGHDDIKKFAKKMGVI